MYFPPNSKGQSTQAFQEPEFRDYEHMKNWMLKAATGLKPKNPDLFKE